MFFLLGLSIAIAGAVFVIQAVQNPESTNLLFNMDSGRQFEVGMLTLVVGIALCLLFWPSGRR